MSGCELFGGVDAQADTAALRLDNRRATGPCYDFWARFVNPHQIVSPMFSIGAHWVVGPFLIALLPNGSYSNGYKNFGIVERQITRNSFHYGYIISKINNKAEY
ncbi:MAG TPA: hypothetical protein DCS88_12920 [Alphaproteobacteria bacterium]|nr:hypothetical protein [Alphaproteobacteria bacterium]